MSNQRFRLSVCQGPDCRDNGADRLFVQAGELVRKAGLGARCELARGGCYGMCHLGANVVVRELKPGPKDPFAADDFQLTFELGETWYAHVSPEGLERVVDLHLRQGRVVADLVGDPDAEGDFRKKA